MTYLSVFLQNNQDYLSFVYGLFYLLAGSVAWLLDRRKTSDIPWLWFALFAASNGIRHWFSLMALNFSLPDQLNLSLHWGAGLFALTMLTEFSRRIYGGSILIYPIIVLIVTLGVWLWPECLFAECFSLIFIPFMVSAAAAFWRSAAHAQGFLRPISIVMGIQTAFMAAFSGLYFTSSLNLVLWETLVHAFIGSILFGLLWAHYLRYDDDTDKLPASSVREILLPLGILGFHLIAGWMFADYLGKHRSDLLKNELMERTAVAANSIDTGAIRTLNASASDTTVPAYDEIKHHLIHIRVVSRFLYLFTLRNQEVIFIADSEPEDSPDLSPPGQKFTEATPAFLNALGNKGPTVLDPETDRWGTWVSIVIPLPTALKDGSPVYFGADVDAKLWIHQILNTRLSAIVIVLLFVILHLYSHISTLHLRRINARLNEEIGLFVGGPSFVVKWLISGSVFRTLYSSPNTVSLLGYNADSLMSGEVRLTDLIHPEDRHRFNLLISALSAKPQNHGEIEFRLLNAQGDYRWFHAFILTKNHIYTLSYHAYFTDIDDRKQGEFEVRKLSERLMLHFKQVPFAIIEWDTDFRVMEWNPAAEKIFGYTREEAIGQRAHDLIVPPDDLPYVSSILSELLIEGGNQHSINNNVTKEGNIITCEWHNISLIDEEGSVIGAASVAEDITDKRKAEEKIEYLAYYDELTGLPNRTLFKDHAGIECRRADRNHTHMAVIFLDIDFFKTINDTLGHEIGNKLLQSFGERLKQIFRNSDTVSRFGGDEFAILLPDVKQIDDIEHVLQDLLHRFKTPLNIDEHELYLTLSIGYSIYPEDGSDPEMLLRHADIAMYAAKEAGRNTYRRYYPGLTEAVTHQLSIHNGLINAFKQNEFVLYYQPQYDISSGRITGAEALIRWLSPGKGLISPDTFIPVAEKTGLIVPLGEWVFRTACDQLKRLEELGFDTFTMAVNLSARQFKEKNFFNHIRTILEKSGVRPESIELELTESILIGDTTEVLAVLNDFKKSGIRLSLDDFGTGYSSLSYLKLFPIDKVKIDQSFTKNATHNDSDRNLVKAVIAMSNALNLTTIAEGVETREQFDLMRQEGCAEIQGYLIGKPMNGEELESFLATFSPPY